MSYLNLNGTSTCRTLYLFVLYSSIGSIMIELVMALLLFIKIAIIYKKFFIKKFVSHDAYSTDDDIIIIL